MDDDTDELRRRVEAAELVNYVVLPRVACAISEKKEQLEQGLRELMEIVDTNKEELSHSLYIELCRTIGSLWMQVSG